MNKQCAKCGAEKLSSDFYNDRSRKDGKFPYCKICSSEWAKKNKDRVKEIHKIWVDNNRDANIEHKKKWLANNLEKRKESQRKYDKRNTAKRAAQEAKRRATILQATPKWADLEAIKDVYKEAEYFQMQVDHIFPLMGKNICGLHVWDNLQLLSAYKNRRKGNKFNLEEQT